MTLAWDTSAEPEVAGYNVYYGVTSHSYTNVVAVSNVTTTTIAGLAEGRTYFFAATAYNSLGLESDFSNEASYTVPTSGSASPTISDLTDQTVSLNSFTADIPFLVGDVDTAATNLMLSASSSNPALAPVSGIVIGGSGSNRTVRVTPALNQSGTATINLAVDDGSGHTASDTFMLTVLGNQPPTLDAPSNLTLDQDAGEQTVNLSGISSGAANEDQTMTVTASSSNPALIPDPTVNYASPNNTGAVTFTPTAGATGSATITVIVNDSQAQNNTTTRTFTVTVNTTNTAPITSKLILTTNGYGAISPNLGGQDLTIGSTYTLTATPASDHVFGGWSGGITSAMPTLTFVMSPNLVLQANFVPSPFSLVAGSYNGLFYEADEVRQSSAGSFTLSVTASGSYSGKLKMGGNSYSFSGVLDGQCQATKIIPRSGYSPLMVTLRIGMNNESDRIFGSVSDGIWMATLLGDRAVFNSASRPAPCAGKYTLVLPGQDPGTSVPVGDGYGTIQVSTAGVATLAGVLADGTAVSQSAPVSKNGLWPLYVSLYSGKGSVVSWIAFTNQTNNDLNGGLSWIKPANARARYYPLGFTNVGNVTGSVYVLPANTDRVLNFTNGTITFHGGNLSQDFSNALALGVSGRVTNLSNNTLSMSFSALSGTFSGTVKDPTSGKSYSFKGAALQKANTGHGFLLGTSESSQVLLAP